MRIGQHRLSFDRSEHSNSDDLARGLQEPSGLPHWRQAAERGVEVYGRGGFALVEVSGLTGPRIGHRRPFDTELLCPTLRWPCARFSTAAVRLAGALRCEVIRHRFLPFALDLGLTRPQFVI